MQSMRTHPEVHPLLLNQRPTTTSHPFLMRWKVRNHLEEGQVGACLTPSHLGCRPRPSQRHLSSNPVHLTRCTSAPCAMKPRLPKRSSPLTSGPIMRSNLIPIPMTRLVRQRSTTAVFAERCSRHSRRLTDTCWSILVNGRSAVTCVARPSRRMATCIDTRGPMATRMLLLELLEELEKTGHHPGEGKEGRGRIHPLQMAMMEPVLAMDLQVEPA